MVGEQRFGGLLPGYPVGVSDQADGLFCKRIHDPCPARVSRGRNIGQEDVDIVVFELHQEFRLVARTDNDKHIGIPE